MPNYGYQNIGANFTPFVNAQGGRSIPYIINVGPDEFLTSISVYLAGTSFAITPQVALYEYKSGLPRQRLSPRYARRILAALPNWYTFPTDILPLSPTGLYTLALGRFLGNFNFYFDIGVTDPTTRTNQQPLPDNWGPTTTRFERMSMYITTTIIPDTSIIHRPCCAQLIT